MTAVAIDLIRRHPPEMRGALYQGEWAPPHAILPKFVPPIRCSAAGRRLARDMGPIEPSVSLLPYRPRSHETRLRDSVF